MSLFNIYLLLSTITCGLGVYSFITGSVKQFCYQMQLGNTVLQHLYWLFNNTTFSSTPSHSTGEVPQLDHCVASFILSQLDATYGRAGERIQKISTTQIRYYTPHHLSYTIPLSQTKVSF